jgi:hypothetical protein
MYFCNSYFHDPATASASSLLKARQEYEHDKGAIKKTLEDVKVTFKFVIRTR